MCASRTSALIACLLVLSSDLRPAGSTGPATNGSSDYVELSSTRPGANNHTTALTLVNKCCPRDHHLDADNLLCVADDAPLASSNHSGHLFREGMPDCGEQGVMSVRVAEGASGLVVEGAPGRYCIDGDPRLPREAVVVACEDPAVFCRNRTCYRKCCPLGQSYELAERKCKRTEEPFRPVFYELSSLSRVEGMRAWAGGIYFSDGCGSKGKYLLERDLGEVSYLGVDGWLLVPAFKKRFPVSEYCVESVKNGNKSAIESFLCFSKNTGHFENSPLQFFLLSLGFIISCMFLMFTFFVYILTPKCQNLYGKTLMCYIASLFTAYLCLAIIELKSKEVDRSACTYMGYFLLFAFLAAFFWLNVISFDIWRTFRLNRSVERSKNDKRRLQFLWYSLYAWGLPAAITALCAYANQAASFPYEPLRPDIGVDNCWFSKKKKGILLFFIAPISLVIALNVLFYVQTACKIWKVKADVNKMEQQKTRRFSANKDQFIINGKLFIVMGITWSLEIISFFLPHPIWYLTDTANALHGVFIFAVFVLRKKVLHQVSEQVRAPLKRMRQLTTSNSEEPSTRKNCPGSTPQGKAPGNGSLSG